MDVEHGYQKHLAIELKLNSIIRSYKHRIDNMLLTSRLELLDGCVTATISFGFYCLPILQTFANKFDAMRNKMLRAIVGLAMCAWRTMARQDKAYERTSLVCFHAVFL